MVVGDASRLVIKPTAAGRAPRTQMRLDHRMTQPTAAVTAVLWHVYAAHHHAVGATAPGTRHMQTGFPAGAGGTMELKAVADMNVIALGTRQCVSVMLDITAPVAPEPQARPAQSVQIVLDRSGSMDGPRLRAAQQAVSALVTRLHPDDCFGMVVFEIGRAHV